MLNGERILITGSHGLIGSALRTALNSYASCTVIGLDINGSAADRGDIRDRAAVRRAIDGCTGIVHLGAVSRVVLGERDPDKCWATNVGGLSVVIDEMERKKEPPWIIFASSREVYGTASHAPVTEDSPLCPVNTYGRSKVEGERLVTAANERGLRTAIVRLSNVYGSTADHPDRVVPAFALAATTGGQLRVEGATNMFDFTHIDDTTLGLLAVIRCFVIFGVRSLPPVNLVTQKATTLYQLASMAIELGGGRASLTYARARSFDVSFFCGSRVRASTLLGWAPRVGIRDGLERLIKDFAAVELPAT